MLWYTLRRIAYILPILVGVSIVCFSFVHLAPGDPMTAVMPDFASPELIAQIKGAYGFDRPLPIQYFRWLGAVLSGDLGMSTRTARPVLDELLPAVLNTAQLAVAGVVISLVLGIGLGVWAAYTRRLAADRAITSAAIVGVSVPPYWVGMVLVAIFAVTLGLLPAMGMAPPDNGGFGLDDVRFMVLPALTLAMIPTGIIARSVRATVMDVRKQEFVQTLYANGLSRRRIFLHVIKNAAPSVLAIMGLQVAQLLGGSILVETVFAWPGTGYLLNNAIATRDLPLLQGTILVLAIFFVMMNFLVDLAQPFLDPRIKRQ
ncbi:MAG: ABC transporter permease [Deltaproteobacteria bacterium RIFCSPLOWO2_12_FULL_57_22]|nr:MAG: ABC transporter permease [Deltaproteobacteria bacterium RIFCSPLOWO2_12_FULL_57_22]